MRMTKANYEAWVRVFENDNRFCIKYQITTTCSQRRRLIRDYISHQTNSPYATDIEDGEQLRRYLDTKWQLTYGIEGAEKYVHLDDVWAEELSQPNPEPEMAYINSLPPTKEPNTMSTTTPIEITTKTYVNGNDISKMSDSEIYALIASEEARIEELKKIKSQPKRLVAEIAKRETGIAALVAHLDSKE